MTTKPNEPEAPCALCGNPKHRHGSGYPATCPIIPTYRAPDHPVADAGGVTEADREAYLAMNMLPEFDAADVRAGLWDKVTGVQAFARHRLQSVAAATAAKDAEIRMLAAIVGKLAKADCECDSFYGHTNCLSCQARAALSEAREADDGR
ncbi:hypothetical protein [Sphingobium sp.]|uniref:hypothetical protein n=1 Tax=Sphingobium sp. TaxID=1912891 RepID=UPI002579616F|nr:hypothetical protein [Sphingobium sp.]MBR2268275.1 hypothetical protein [Sphingobium sp.]